MRNNRIIAVSSIFGLLCFFVLSWDALPGVEYIVGVVVDLFPARPDNNGNWQRPVGTAPSTRDRLAEVGWQFFRMSDDDLRSISLASKPCSTRLIDCHGLSQTYIKRLATGALAARAERRELELKERAQLSNDRNAMAASEAARAATLSAQAAQANADAAEKNIWITATGSAIAFFSVVFAGLTWWDKRIAPSTPTPVVVVPQSPPSPPTT